MVARRKHIKMFRTVTGVPKSLSILESYYYNFRSARDIMNGIEGLESGKLHHRQMETCRKSKNKAQC